MGAGFRYLIDQSFAPTTPWRILKSGQMRREKRNVLVLKHRLLLGMVLLRYVLGRLVRLFSKWEESSIPVPFLINLPSRADRLTTVSQEFQEIGIKPRLVPGVPHPDGAIGCAMAHRNLLRSLEGSTGRVAWIVEDDVAFDVGREELLHVVRAFLNNDGLDVLCLSHLTPRHALPVSREFAISVSTFTTACYLVKPRAIELLEKSFTESLIMLSLGAPPEQAAIDVHWRKLQRRKLVFCVPRKPIAYQVPSFSDTAGKEVDYFRRASKAG